MAVITCFLQPAKQKQENKDKFIDITNTPKHNSKVTGVVVKADKCTLHQPQKIFLFLLPKTKEVKTKRVFFGLHLHLCPPACGHSGIMFKCIFRRRLAGWWLVAYTCSSVRFHFYYLGGAVPLVSIQLLWLQFSVGKLPF